MEEVLNFLPCNLGWSPLPERTASTSGQGVTGRRIWEIPLLYGEPGDRAPLAAFCDIRRYKKYRLNQPSSEIFQEAIGSNNE